MRERRKRRIYQAFSFAIHRKVWWLCVLDIMILMGRELWCSSSVSLWCVLCCVCVSPSSRRQSERASDRLGISHGVSSTFQYIRSGAVSPIVLLTPMTSPFVKNGLVIYGIHRTTQRPVLNKVG